MTQDEEARERDLSAAIREKADYHRAPASLVEAVRASLPASEESPSRLRFWLLQGAALAGVAFITWAATMGYLLPGQGNDGERLADEILASHVRATLGKRLYDVASSDHHTVKPWLSARLAYSPPVADLSAQGFALVGARLDHVGGQPVAVLVYGRRKHTIEAYVWPARGPATDRTLVRDGFNMQSFSAANMNYWLVSDLNRNELGDLARLLAQQAAAL